MFEFTKNVADNVASQLGRTKGDMLNEADEYEKSAREKEAKASENEAKATQDESDASIIELNPQRTVVEEEYDPETNTYKKVGETSEPDTAKAAENKALYDSLLAEATKLRKEAADLRKEAANLAGLAASLRFSAGDLEGALKDLQLAIENSTKAITQSINLLNNEIDSIRSAISAFNFGIPKEINIGSWISNIGNNISNIINLDNFNTKIQEGLNWLYEIGKKTGAKISEGFTSGIVGIFDEIIKPFITGANPLKNVVVFGLGLMGIYTEPQIDPAYIVEDERIDNAKKEAINLYNEYLNTLNISEEQKEQYRQAFEEKIQNAVVLKNEYFEGLGFGATTMGVYIGKSGGKGTGYIKEDALNGEYLVNILIHEVGGHGVGTMGQSKLSQNGGIYIYDIKDINKVPNNFRMNIHAGMEEAVTEYVTGKICKEKNEGCHYNYSVDLLEKMLGSMTKHGICDGDALVYENYVGNDKKLLENKVNEIFGDDSSVEYMNETIKLNYSTISDIMYGANGGSNGFDLNDMNKVAEEFDKKCAEYAEKNKS